MNRRSFLQRFATGVIAAATLAHVPAFVLRVAEDEKLALIRRLMDNALAENDRLIDAALFGPDDGAFARLING
jgi:hypothetical protein